jgi:hypothetical protein
MTLSALVIWRGFLQYHCTRSRQISAQDRGWRPRPQLVQKIPNNITLRSDVRRPTITIFLNIEDCFYSKRCIMRSLRGFCPIGKILSSQSVPLLSRTTVTPTPAIATATHRWSSMLILFHRGVNITPSILTSIPRTINDNFPYHEMRRCMSKFLSKSATKRLPLTTKRAGKGYYKGKGCTSEGRLTSKGKFIADPMKKLQLIVPDLTGFTLKPYIARTVAKSPPPKDQASVAGM